MPCADTLTRFIALVEANRHVEAIEQFYAPHASMQDNDLPLRPEQELELPQAGPYVLYVEGARLGTNFRGITSVDARAAGTHTLHLAGIRPDRDPANRIVVALPVTAKIIAHILALVAPGSTVSASTTSAASAFAGLHRASRTSRSWTITDGEWTCASSGP